MSRVAGWIKRPELKLFTVSPFMLKVWSATVLHYNTSSFALRTWCLHFSRHQIVKLRQSIQIGALHQDRGGSGYNHHNGRSGQSEKEQINMYTHTHAHAFKRLFLVPDWRVNTEQRRCVAGGLCSNFAFFRISMPLEANNTSNRQATTCKEMASNLSFLCQIFPIGSNHQQLL